MKGLRDNILALFVGAWLIAFMLAVYAAPFAFLWLLI